MWILIGRTTAVPWKTNRKKKKLQIANKVASGCTTVFDHWSLNICNQFNALTPSIIHEAIILLHSRLW